MNVRATFSGVAQPVLEVVMSRSSPGRYALHEFAKNIYGVSAQDENGRELDLTRATPYQWNITGHKGTVILNYTVFGDRADGTYDGIDATHAHLNGPATFAWAHGMERDPITVAVQIPEGSKWKVETQLTRLENGIFSAPDVDRLIDSPMEISDFTETSWNVGDAQFRMALHHAGTTAEAAAFAKAVEAVVIEEQSVFGSFPKYGSGQYTFLLDYLRYVNGDGMEHRDSTSISSTGSLLENGSGLLGAVAHEFFHSWNVERMRPQGLEPFDLERADMTGELWFAEGFTNYYGPLSLKRAGLVSLENFAGGMGRAVSQVLTRPGPRARSAVEMSQLAPFVDAASSIDPTNFSNTYLSYYTFGQALALGIDLSIRQQFPGKSLDDWMAAMWRRHPDVHRPYGLLDLETALAEVTTASFASNIFRQYILGREAMDYKSLLAKAGFQLIAASPGKAWVESGFRFTDKGAEIAAQASVGGPFYKAGLDRGDRIISWNGEPIKAQKDLDRFLAARKPGDKVQLKVETRSGERAVTLTLAETPDLKMVANEMAGVALTPEMLEMRESWLASKAQFPLPMVLKHCHQCLRELPFEYEHCPYDGSNLHIAPKQ